MVVDVWRGAEGEGPFRRDWAGLPDLAALAPLSDEGRGRGTEEDVLGSWRRWAAEGFCRSPAAAGLLLLVAAVPAGGPEDVDVPWLEAAVCRGFVFGGPSRPSWASSRLEGGLSGRGGC